MKRLIAACLLSTACAENVLADLDQLCTIASALEADTQVKADQKPRLLAYRLRDAGFGSQANAILEKAAEAPDRERYYQLRLLAVEAGYANYECGSLKRMFGGVLDGTKP